MPGLMAGVTAMSLNARDRHALGRIEEDLTRSDPRFAARMTAFSRLTEDEEMPAREQIRPFSRSRRSPCSRRTLCSRRALCWTAGIVWLVISLAMLAVALILSHASTTTGCAGGRSLVRCGQVSCPRAVTPLLVAPSGTTGRTSCPRITTPVGLS